VKCFLMGVLVALFGVWNMHAAEDLDGVRGKIFNVDASARGFELLTETVIDPQTHEGKSRHTVYWDAETEFVKVVRHRSFKAITERVFVEFYALPERHAAAIEAGQPFRCKHVKVLPAAVSPLGLSKDRQRLRGWFTVDPTSPKHRDGVIAFNGTSLKASLPGPHGEVDVYTPANAAALNEGFWETHIQGTRVDGRFIAKQLEIYPVLDPRTVDDPALPRVLVVGDSISMNYHEAAKAELAGIANYYRVEGNAGPSDRGVTCIELWLGDYTQKGLHWDLIQFNHGLHDLKQDYDEATKRYGAHQLDLESYKANLEKEIAVMRKTGAQLMWCSTTPIPKSSVGRWGDRTMGRRNGEDQVFNQAALEVLAKHPDILINDLNKAIRESEFFDAWSQGTDVHYWDGAQQVVVGKAVAQAIKQALASPRP
jgi:hypothetical protein